MARIPLQSQVSARQAGAQVQPGAFAQTAQATANLVSSVAGAANMVEQQFAQAQDLKNRSEISEKKRQIREAQGIFQNELLQGNVDPSEWGPRWQTRLKEVKAQLGLDSSKVAPAVKREVGEAFNQFSGSSFIQISGAALKETARKAKQNFDRDQNFYYQTHDWDGARQNIEDNRDILGDDLADDALRSTGLAERNDSLDISRETDTYEEHVNKIKAGEFGDSEVLKQRYLQKADTERDRKEAKSLRNLSELDAAGLIDGEEDMKFQVENDPNISKDAGADYLENYKANKPLPEKDQFDLQDKVDDLFQYRKNPDKYEEEWMKVQTAVNAYGNRKGVGRFNADLHNIRPGLYTQDRADKAQAEQREEDLKPLQTVANGLVRERASGLASVAYARDQNRAGDLNADQLAGNAALKSQLDEHALLLRSALQEEVNRFIRSSTAEGASPTEADVKEFLDRNADRINLDVMNNLRAAKSSPFNAAGPGGSVLPGLSEGEKSAEAARLWLDPDNELPK